MGISLVIQWLRFGASTVGVSGSIPGQGTQTPHAVWHAKKQTHTFKLNSKGCIIQLGNKLFENAKGNSLGRKHKRRKRPTENKPKTVKKMVIGSYISIITLNVNGLNAPTKRQTGWVVENVHVCTSTYHSTLLDPPNCM